MVQARFLNIIFYFALFVINIRNGISLSLDLAENPKNLLEHLMENKGNAPLVIVVDTKRQQDSLDDDLIGTSEDGLLAKHGSEMDANEDAKYLLYHLLRTSSQDDAPDSSLEETKVLLRQALRARCQKVDTCVKKCPKKKLSCPMNCQQVFDNLNLCEPPKKPKRPKCGPKCGKTLPPSWRF